MAHTSNSADADSPSPPTDLQRRLFKRFLPLYVAAFFQGFVLWYAIEKLFMHSIGFDDAGIGLMIALYSIVMLLTETPSGILADRWSRKGVLILASVALIASGLLAGLSHSPLPFLISSALWGVYFALYSGTYDSIVYDTLAEEVGNSSLFEKYFGRIQAVDSVALVLSSVLGGALANAINIRAPYFASILFGILSIVALLVFKEPTLHKQADTPSIIDHTTQTLKAVLRNRQLLPITSTLILLSVMLYMVLEFSQVWLLALAVPALFFGIANAIMLAGLGLGGLLAGGKRAKASPHFVAACMVGLIACSLGLALVRNAIVVVACQLLFCTFILAITVVFNRLLHDKLTSNIRAGASSAISTVSRLIIIPLALLFGYISREASIFRSAYILVGLVLLMAIIVVAHQRRQARM